MSKRWSLSKHGSEGLSTQQLGKVYNALVDEFVDEHRADNEETWEAIRQRIDLRAPGPKVVPLRLPKAGLSPTKAGTSRRRHKLLAALAAACIGLSFWSLSVYPSSTDSLAGLSYTIGDERVSLSVMLNPRGKLVASEEAPVKINFSDESLVALHPHSTLRLVMNEEGSVKARLAQGKLQVDVEHHDDTDYRFRAGPYEVHVVGTTFELAFSPEGERLDLLMREGRVIVTGPQGERYEVGAGEELHLGARLGRDQETIVKEPSKPESERQSPSSAPGSKLPFAGGRQDRSLAKPAQSPHSAKNSGKGKAVTFRALARKGDFSQIVAQAKSLGLERALMELPAGELQELAQAARYTGDSALAERVWRKMGVRFSGSVAAQNAVFFLGRMAEQQGGGRAAIRYYTTYLESGAGSYRAEALGRKLQLVRSRGGETAALPVAEEYLRRFPSGPYARVARQIAKD